jgi:hypothetical protein
LRAQLVDMRVHIHFCSRAGKGGREKTDHP